MAVWTHEVGDALPVEAGAVMTHIRTVTMELLLGLDSVKYPLTLQTLEILDITITVHSVCVEKKLKNIYILLQACTWNVLVMKITTTV